MSCHLKTTGRVQTVGELRTFFFPHLLKEVEKNGEEGDGWGDSDWGWEATENKVSDGMMRLIYASVNEAFLNAGLG